MAKITKAWANPRESHTPKNSLARLPYDNYKILHPDGTLMCFCSKKKTLWYLKNNLAVMEGEHAIKLTFEPKGYGDPMDILIGRSNNCVITNSTEHLTKHHVVPTQYRRHFATAYKDKNSCDLVVLCRDKHDEYERIATDFKNKLYEDYIDDSYTEINRAWSEAKSIYNCVTKYFDDLPVERQVFMNMRLEGLREKWGFTDKELKAPFLNSNHDYNRIIVEKVGTVNMIIMWKLHFVKHGMPKFLPAWWKPNMIKVVNRGMNNAKTDLMEIDLNEPSLLNLIKKYDLYDVASLYI